MYTPQAGIFALGTSSHAYLEFDLLDAKKCKELASAISAIRAAVEPIRTDDQQFLAGKVSDKPIELEWRSVTGLHFDPRSALSSRIPGLAGSENQEIAQQIEIAVRDRIVCHARLFRESCLRNRRGAAAHELL